MPTIHHLTTTALHLDVQRAGSAPGIATGFTVESGGRQLLVTNRHVVEPLTNPGDMITVWLHKNGTLGSWQAWSFRPVAPNGSPLWRGHPDRTVDIAIVQISPGKDLISYPVNLAWTDTQMIVEPSEPVSIIGFPKGLNAGGRFPIWKTGHVASDLELPALGLPGFLIDTRTKDGMSGSPVFAVRTGTYRSTPSNVQVGNAIKFLGLYSGRLTEDGEQPDRFDIGFVWSPAALREAIVNFAP